MKEIKLYNQSTTQTFKTYEKKFKALTDQKKVTHFVRIVSAWRNC